MVRMEKVDRSVLSGILAKTKWLGVIDQFEREGHEIVKISEGERKASCLRGCLFMAIKNSGKAGILACKIINGECYLLRKELLENGR